MKSVHVFLAALFFIAVNSYSQTEVNQITHNSKERYITTSIGFPVQGTYAPIGMKEPITVLNPDGTGFIQTDDLSKKKINWGIECSEEGVAIFKEGFNSKSYTFWYRPNDSNEWYYSQFSIHFAKKKMFLMGERVKAYEDYNVQ